MGLRLVVTGVVVLAASCMPVPPRRPSDAPTARALRCLDVTVHPHARAADESNASMHVVFELANRCEWPVHVDFAGAVVDVALVDGSRERLVPNTVDGSAPSAVLDAYIDGTENIGYVASSGRSDVSYAIAAACIDVSRLAWGEATAAQPACVRRVRDDVYESVDAVDLDGALAARSVGANTTVQPIAVSSGTDGGPGCTDVSDGARWCDSFATWRRQPPVTTGVGFSLHHFDLAHRSISIADASGAMHDVPARALGSFDTTSLDFEMIGGYLGPLFIGGEFQWLVDGWLGASDIAARGETSSLGVGGVGSMPGVGAGLVVGLQLPRVAMFSSQLELYGGGMFAVFEADAATSSNYSCDSDGCGAPGMSSWIVEPRLRVRGWVRAQVSLDGWGGYGIGPSQGDWSLGMALTLHGRSFDGSY